MSQDWKIGDQVIHPRRPEWGKGKIQSGQYPKFKIFFDNSGIKTLDLGLVQLERWDAHRNQIAKSGEARKTRMKSAPNHYGSIYTREWEFEYITAWKKFWQEGALAREWADKYPHLFFDTDLQDALLDHGGAKPGHFYSWLGAILVWEQFQFPTLIAWAKLNSDTQNRLKQILGSKQYELWQSIKTNRTWIDRPQNLIFRQDFSKCSLVRITEDRKEISPNILQADLELGHLLGIEIDLVRIRSEKFLHILAGQTPA